MLALRCAGISGSGIDFKKFAEDQNVGYSYFRKMFKQYTGNCPGTISPGS